MLGHDYNYIDETPENYILYKNANLLPIDEMFFKGIWIEWAFDPNDNKVKIRKMVYPKLHYDRVDIENIAEKTIDCPFCRTGFQINENNISQLEKNYIKSTSSSNSEYQKNNNGSIDFMQDIKNAFSNFKGITQFLDPLTSKISSRSGVPADQISQILGGELIAALLEIPVDMFTTALGRKLIKGAVGAVLVGLSVGGVFKGRPSAEVMEIGTHWLAEVLDPDKGIMDQLSFDIQNLKDAFSFGDPLKAASAFFTPVNELAESAKNLMNSITGGNASFGALNPKSLIGSFGNAENGSPALQQLTQSSLFGITEGEGISMDISPGKFTKEELPLF